MALTAISDRELFASDREAGIRWGSFLVLGILVLVAGLIAFANLLIATVASVLYVGVRMRPLHGWGWLVASGVVTMLVGVLIVLGWPSNALWILGMFLAIDLTFMGVALLSLALALRRAIRSAPGTP